MTQCQRRRGGGDLVSKPGLMTAFRRRAMLVDPAGGKGPFSARLQRDGFALPLRGASRSPHSPARPSIHREATARGPVASRWESAAWRGSQATDSRRVAAGRTRRAASVLRRGPFHPLGSQHRTATERCHEHSVILVSIRMPRFRSAPLALRPSCCSHSSPLVLESARGSTAQADERDATDPS